MNDAFRFAASCSSPRELITRLQFGRTELWPDDVRLPTKWHYVADLIESDRGLLAELDGAVSTPVLDALTATAELCRQSATGLVSQSDWAYLRRAVRWLQRDSSKADRAVLAVGEELALTGIDAEEPDFSIVAWLCLETLAQHAVDCETIDYWVRRGKVRTTHAGDLSVDSAPQERGPVKLSVAV